MSISPSQQQARAQALAEEWGRLQSRIDQIQSELLSLLHEGPDGVVTRSSPEPLPLPYRPAQRRVTPDELATRAIKRPPADKAPAKEPSPLPAPGTQLHLLFSYIEHNHDRWVTTADAVTALAAHMPARNVSPALQSLLRRKLISRVVDPDRPRGFLWGMGTAPLPLPTKPSSSSESRREVESKGAPVEPLRIVRRQLRAEPEE